MKKNEAGALQSNFPGQHEGEAVQLVFRQHPVVMRKSLIFGMLIVLVGTLPLLAWSSTPLITNIGLYNIALIVVWVSLFGSALYWFHAWFSWFYSVYIITSERIVEIKQQGFFNRKVNEVRLEKIHNVNYQIQGLQAVLFQYGDIVAQAYVGDIVMKTIHKPVEVHEQILDVIRKAGYSTPTGI